MQLLRPFAVDTGYRIGRGNRQNRYASVTRLAIASFGTQPGGDCRACKEPRRELRAVNVAVQSLPTFCWVRSASLLLPYPRPWGQEVEEDDDDEEEEGAEEKEERRVMMMIRRGAAEGGACIGASGQ